MNYLWSLLRFIRVLPLLGLLACAPMRLVPGTYIETRGPGVVMLAGQTVRLAEGQTFAYNYWSDDMASGRYGQGTYHLRGHQLHLEFGAAPLVVAAAVARPLATSPDSLVLEFLVLARPPGHGAEVAPLAYATIAAHTESEKVVEVSSDSAGHAVLRLPRTARWLSVKSLGFSPWWQECPPSSTAYRLELPAKQGTPYAAGTSKSFRLARRQPARTLLVREGAMQVVFERQPNPRGE